jgi:hypothetical protein
VHVIEIKEVWKFINFISAEIPEPVLPEDDLVKTIASLKKDMALLKKQVLPRKPEA